MPRGAAWPTPLQHEAHHAGTRDAPRQRLDGTHLRGIHAQPRQEGCEILRDRLSLESGHGWTCPIGTENAESTSESVPARRGTRLKSCEFWARALGSGTCQAPVATLPAHGRNVPPVGLAPAIGRPSICIVTAGDAADAGRI